jgi:hypothetical protein
MKTLASRLWLIPVAAFGLLAFFSIASDAWNKAVYVGMEGAPLNWPGNNLLCPKCHKFPCSPTTGYNYHCDFCGHRFSAVLNKDRRVVYSPPTE